jgi:nucleoid-associated protein YgaU
VQGEWSVVLEKPLPAGDHALSLKIISPDGTRALTSQESVRVAVGADEKKETSPAAAMEAANPSPPQATAPQTNASTAPAPAPPEAARAGEIQALTRAEQGASSAPATGTAESKPAPPKPTLVFKTVDYAETGSGTGTVTITGTSDPGAKISIYYGAEAIAEVRADGEGRWRVAVAKKLGMGQHGFRAERVDAAGVAGTALVTIERVEPKPEPPASQVAGVEAGKGAAPGPVSRTTSAATYIIRRGDTLWAIAKRYLGSGLRYTTIFEDNRQVIDNPDLIHPKQQVTVPKP